MADGDVKPFAVGTEDDSARARAHRNRFHLCAVDHRDGAGAFAGDKDSRFCGGSDEEKEDASRSLPDGTDKSVCATPGGV
jgi:hypothetical protein